MNMQTTIEAEQLYDRDFHAWLQVQARLLRRGEVDALDLPNLLEEIEDMGASQISELESRLAIIIEHLLKFHHGANRQPAAGWKRTLLTQRYDLARLLKKSPSLRRLVENAVQENYTQARRLALASFEEYEPHLLDRYTQAMPTDCPYTTQQILDEDWLPEPQE